MPDVKGRNVLHIAPVQHQLGGAGKETRILRIWFNVEDGNAPTYRVNSKSANIGSEMMNPLSSINFQKYTEPKGKVSVYDRRSETFRMVSPSESKKKRYRKAPSRGPARPIPFYRSMGLGGSIADAADFRIRKMIGQKSKRK